MSDRCDESSGASGGGGGTRAQRKKQRRGGPHQQQQQQQRRQGTPHGRGQKNRQPQRRQQESAGPSAAFLAALEEQRENERRRQELQQQQQQQEHADELMGGAQRSATSAGCEQGVQRQEQRPVTTGAIAASAPPSATPAQQRKPAHIAGFYYDESQKRYFKLTPQMKQRMKQSKQQRDAKERDAAMKKALQARRERHSAAAGTRSRLQGNRGWVGYVAERESSSAWSAGRHDQREMVPRLFASTMATQELRSVHMNVSTPLRRITALEFRSVGDYAAMGFSGGRLDIVRISIQEDFRSGFARQGEREIRVAEHLSVGMSYQISALKWRPDDSLANATHLVCACVGGDSSSSSLAAAAPHNRGQNTGFVCFFKVRDGIEDITQKWSFNDPWSVAWNPRDAGRFAVGLSGPICAAYVDVQAHNGVQNAPTGRIKSDVMAQAFSNDGNTIFNGTRNGSMWLWDLRASRRAQEHSVAATTAASQVAGSAVDLHVLSDGFQVLVQKSNGELRLVDTRKNATAVVVEYAPGRKNTYLPMLKCAVDDTETVVVAAGWDGEDGSSSVCSYEISSGKILSQVVVNKSQMSRAAMPPLEQVHFRVRDSVGRPHERDAVLPEVWALSRNELFVCEEKGWTGTKL